MSSNNVEFEESELSRVASSTPPTSSSHYPVSRPRLTASTTSPHRVSVRIHRSPAHDPSDFTPSLLNPEYGQSSPSSAPPQDSTLDLSAFYTMQNPDLFPEYDVQLMSIWMTTKDEIPMKLVANPKLTHVGVCAMMDKVITRKSEYEMSLKVLPDWKLALAKIDAEVKKEQRKIKAEGLGVESTVASATYALLLDKYKSQLRALKSQRDGLKAEYTKRIDEIAAQEKQSRALLGPFLAQYEATHQSDSKMYDDELRAAVWQKARNHESAESIIKYLHQQAQVKKSTLRKQKAPSLLALNEAILNLDVDPSTKRDLLSKVVYEDRRSELLQKGPSQAKELADQQLRHEEEEKEADKRAKDGAGPAAAPASDRMQE